MVQKKTMRSYLILGRRIFPHFANKGGSHMNITD
jgi:hypothetical protein